MYLNILLIPILSIFVSTFFSNYLGRRGVLFLNLFFIYSTLFFVMLGLYDVIVTNSSIEYSLGSWLSFNSLSIEWSFLFDSLTFSMLLIVVLVSSLVHTYSVSYMRNDPYIIRFFTYLTLFTLFMIFLVTSKNLLILFLGWEGVGLASYLLISFWFTRKEANKSAIKAMFMNRIGDFGVLISIVYCLDLFGSCDYSILYSVSDYFFSSSSSSDSWSLYIICLGFIVGAVGKSSQIGLHTWLPDAMEGPTPVSALIHAATMVTAGVFLILRCSIIFELVPESLFYIAILGSLTALFAATVGLAQNDIKKIIAYSTCSQLGYMVFSCGVSNYSVGLFHLVNHAFFKALLFLGAGVIIHALMEEQDIRKMGGLISYLPFTYSLFLISSFSLIGFPFLSGYYSKDFLLELSYLSFSPVGLFSYLIGSVVAGITAFYSFKLIYFTFIADPKYSLKKLLGLHAYDFYNFVALLPLILGSVFSGFLLKDLFLGYGSTFWNSSYFYSDFGLFYNNIVAISFFYKMFPFLLSMVGLFSVYSIYLFFPSTVYNLFKNSFFNKIYIYLSKAWFFNALYNRFFGEVSAHFSFSVAYSLIDKGILEFFGPLGIKKFFIGFSDKVLLLNTGKFYHYTMTMFYFIVVFLFFYTSFYLFI